MGNGRFDQGHELFPVARKAARHEGRAQQDRQGHQIDRLVGIDAATLGFRALVGGCRELSLGQTVNAVVLADVDHVHAAAQTMGELAEPDGGAVAVARDAEIDQLAVGEIGAGQDARHAPVHGVEAVALAEEIVRRLRRAADARQLGHAMRLDVEFETSLNHGRADGIVAAAGAQGGNAAFVIAAREAELVRRQPRMMQFRLLDVGHSAASLALALFMRSAMAPVMNRAVIGVPS